MSCILKSKISIPTRRKCLFSRYVLRIFSRAHSLKLCTSLYSTLMDCDSKDTFAIRFYYLLRHDFHTIIYIRNEISSLGPNRRIRAD